MECEQPPSKTMNEITENVVADEGMEDNEVAKSAPSTSPESNKENVNNSDEKVE